MEGVADVRGFFPTYMGWAKGLELPKQQTFGTALNHLIHSQVVENYAHDEN